jgi:hypothetical protein
MKYRIVSRNKNPWYGSYIDYPYYYAQMKVFGMWIDCRHHPFKEAYNSYDDMLVVVERWVDAQIHGSQPVTFKEEVVKTYD